MFIEYWPQDTLPSTIEFAFEEAGHGADILSVKVWQDSAFINCRNEEAMLRVARIQNIKIMGQNYDVVILRAKDRDETKGVMGFWKPKAPHVKKMYRMLGKYLFSKQTLIHLMKLVDTTSCTCNLPSGLARRCDITTLLSSCPLKPSETPYSTHKETATTSSAYTRSRETQKGSWSSLKQETYQRNAHSETERMPTEATIRRLTKCKPTLLLLQVAKISMQTVVGRYSDYAYAHELGRNATLRTTQLIRTIMDEELPSITNFVPEICNIKLHQLIRVNYYNAMEYIKYIKIKEIKHKAKKKKNIRLRYKDNIDNKTVCNVMVWKWWIRIIMIFSFIQPVHAQKNILEYIINKWEFMFIALFFTVIQKSIKHIKSTGNSEGIYDNLEKKNHYTFATINVNGITNKMEDIKDFIHKQDADVLCIQKSHITEEENRFFTLEFKQWGYEPYYASKEVETLKKEYIERKIKKINSKENDPTKIDKEIKAIKKNKYKKSGGVITLIKSNLATLMYSEKSKDCRIITTYNIEKRWAIINIYAPTGNISYNNKFFEENVIEAINNVKKKDIPNFYVMRDFNATIDSKNDRWSNFSESTNKRTFKGLENLVRDFKLTDTWRRHNKSEQGFTWNRVASSVKKHKIEISEIRMDLILTNEENNNNCISTIIPEKNIIDSDHKPVVIFVKKDDTDINKPPTFDKYAGKINTRNHNEKSKEILNKK